MLEWKNVKWPEPNKHEQAYYECPDCHKHWNDEMRIDAICDGEWRPTNVFRGVRGYWLNGINTTFSAKKGYKSKLHQMAAEFYDAYTSGEQAMIVWKNTFLCEPHIEASEQIEASPFYDRLENYSPNQLPDDVVVVFLVIDVQADRLEYEFIGLGMNEETWGIEYGKIQGDTEKDQVWEDMKLQLTREFQRQDGALLKVDCVGIDHRHKGMRVRRFVSRCGHPRVYVLYGHSGSSRQGLLAIPTKNSKYRLRMYSVGTDVAKDTLFARMRIKEPGPRYMHYPNGSGYEKKRDGYFDQLTAEESRLTYKRGFPERHYEKIRERNEALDLRVYFLALVDILRPLVAQIRKEHLRKIGKEVVEYVIKPVNSTVNVDSQKQPSTVNVDSSNEKKPMKPQVKRKRFSFRMGM